MDEIYKTYPSRVFFLHFLLQYSSVCHIRDMTLHDNTVSQLLTSSLYKLMSAEEFLPFRLVGGTALSFQLGHRLSIDIDLFSDYEYKSIDFDAIDKYLRREFDYVDRQSKGEIGFGVSYYIGNTAHDCVKLDMFYTDPFIRPALEVDGVL